MPRLVSCVVIILSWIGLPVKRGGTQRMVPHPLPVWGGTVQVFGLLEVPGISIHPPRGGRDLRVWPRYRPRPHFNPPSPCGERPFFFRRASRNPQFQSTLPVWGGTWPWLRVWHTVTDFNPPSPQGEGLQREWANAVIVGRFQSTLPARGGTCGTPGFEGVFAKFQSTLPVWGGTLAMQARCPAGLISIHSPRGGRD